MADGTLGIGIVGIGWVATQHLTAFQKNPHTRIVYLCSRNERRARERLEHAGIDWPPGARFTTKYSDLLESPDVDVISIATPNHLHAAEAVAAARADKHLLLEKPTGLDLKELRAIRDAVRRSGVRTIGTPDGTGRERSAADAATCWPRAATPWMRSAGARGSKRPRSPRITHASRPDTSTPRPSP
jgi:hypothetical protein